MTVDSSIKDQLSAVKAEREASRRDGIAGGGSGPHDPGMEVRVATLEADVRDIKASLKGLEMSSIRIEAVLGTLATKADLAAATGLVNTLTARVDAQEKRLGAVEKAITDTISIALSKSLGAGAIVGMVAGISAIVAAVVGVVSWTLHHFQLG